MTSGRKAVMAQAGAMELGEVGADNKEADRLLPKYNSLDSQSPFMEKAKSATEAAHREASASLLGMLWGGSEYSGVACMAASAVVAAFMGLLVKLLSQHSIPSFEMIFIRSIVVVAIAGMGMHRRGMAPSVWMGSQAMKRVVLARALTGFTAMSMFTYSIAVLPLKDAMVINFTLPIFTAILCSIFLGEAWGLREAAATVLSFAGVVLIARPPFMFGEEASDPLSAGMRLFGCAIGLGGAVAAGGAWTLLRVVGKGGEHPLVPVFALSLVSIPFSGIFMFTIQTAVWPSLGELCGCLLFGLLAFASQALTSRSLQLEKGGRASAMQYLKVLTSFALGIIFLGEIPTVSSAMGALMICVSSAVVVQQAGQS